MGQRSIKEFEVLPSATYSNTVAAFSSTITVAHYIEGVFLLNVTAQAGTNPTVTIVVQTRSDDVNQWYTHTTLSGGAIDISSTLAQAYTLTNLGRKIRVRYTIDGTNTPSGTFSLMFVGKN